jgi:cyclopropane fatty-acyl-phospholipid synthase-like methyltransferase
VDLDYKQSIINYYDATRLDYRILWFRDKNRSVHFGYYDDEVKDHNTALHNMNKVMAERAGIKKGDTVLDAGCGQGGSAVWLANEYDVHVKGITLVPHQVAKAKKHARKSLLKGSVTFHEGDYTQTEFEDESFSVIWACESLCHALNKIDFYNEAYRLLKPGGRLVCAEYLRAARPLSPEGETMLHEWLNGWSIHDIDTSEEHAEHAELAGFSDIEIDDITRNTKPSLRNLHYVSRKLWQLGTILRKVRLRNDVNHGNHYSSIRQYEALENNYWKYGLLSMTKK